MSEVSIWSPRWGEECTGESVGGGELRQGEFEGFTGGTARLRFWSKHVDQWSWAIVRVETLRPVEKPPAVAEPEYFILSLKYSQGAHCEVLLWWRPKNNGYTKFLEAAGRYTHAEVTGHPSYYNDGEATIAIPCHEVEALAHRAVDVDDKYRLMKLAPLAREART